MINEYTRKFMAEGHDVNVVECSIYYSKGGMNYFTGRDEGRGYYFSISPFYDRGNCRQYRGFSGAKTLVLPCDRQSKGRYQKAKSMMDDLVAAYLDGFCGDRGIRLLSHEYEASERER